MQIPALSLPEQRLFDSLYFEALSLRLLGKDEEAFERVGQALEVNPNSAPALYFRSREYLSRNQIVEALDDASRAAGLDSTNIWYVSAAAQLWARKGAVQKAIEEYESLHRQHPDHATTLYHLADLYYRVDSLSKLVDILDEIEEVDGINPNLTMQKFYMLQQMGRLDEGFAAVEKVVKRYPFDVQYRIQLGDLQMQNSMLQEAKKTYDEAAKIDPDNAYVWVALSNYYSVMGNQQAADTLVDAALVHATLDIETKIDILTEYLKSTLRKVAREKRVAQDTTAIVIPGVDELFTKVATMHPSAPEVYDLHASYLNVIGQDSLAMVQESFAVDLRPSDTNYWARLLNYAAKAQDFTSLIKYGHQALEKHPSEVEIYTTMAYTYHCLEKNDSVIWWYRKGIENINPTEVNMISTLYGLLGDTYYEMNDKAKSFECYDEAIKYNENNYLVLNNYAYFITMEEKGDLQKAERMAAKVVQKYPDNATYLDTYAWIFYLQGNYILAKFYQQRAIELMGEEANEDLKLHWEKILEALEQ